MQDVGLNRLQTAGAAASGLKLSAAGEGHDQMKRFQLTLGSLAAILLLAAPAAASPSPAGGRAAAAVEGEARRPLLVVMTETGRSREGSPVYERHPDGERIAGSLSGGFPGRWLRLYAWEQDYLARRRGTTPEPAYLLLSSTQGGFAREGFWLGDEDKRHAGYVDIHRSHPLSGRFGAIDQILPHELAHVILAQLLGGDVQGPSNQVHALGVKTDPMTAFNEGLAESLQVMAIDDPEADPLTRSLASDLSRRKLAERQIVEYGRELGARLAPVSRRRITFPLWFSACEQVMRYHAVKANLFAREAAIPGHLLLTSRLHDAYLFESTQPGSPGGRLKPAGVMLSTEAVVSHLLYRWATDAAIGGKYLDEEFYALFGAARDEVGRPENAYLKMFHAVATGRAADTAALVRAYKREFPEEEKDVDRIVSEALGGQVLPDQPSVWLANGSFRTGTSLFDQYRRFPRVHTFDLNAATLVDLLGVPGVDRRLAETILHHAPYQSTADLAQLPGMSAEAAGTFARMEREMRALAGHEVGGVFASGLFPLLLPYMLRALAVLCISAAAGAVLYSLVRDGSRRRAVLSAAAASLLVLASGWVVEGVPVLSLPFLPAVLFGLPAAAWQLSLNRDIRPALLVVAAWAAASLPAAALIHPWG